MVWEWFPIRQALKSKWLVGSQVSERTWPTLWCYWVSEMDLLHWAMWWRCRMRKERFLIRLGGCQGREDLPLISQEKPEGSKPWKKSFSSSPTVIWCSWGRAEWCGVCRQNLLPLFTHVHVCSSTEQLPAGAWNWVGANEEPGEALEWGWAGPRMTHVGVVTKGKAGMHRALLHAVGTEACEAEKDRVNCVRNKTSLRGDSSRRAGGLYSCGR